jgi:hypothetical protein
MADPYADPGGYYRQTLAGARDITKPPEGTWGDFIASTVPGFEGLGFLSHRQKAEAQKLNDARYDYVLKRLTDAYGDPYGGNHPANREHIAAFIREKNPQLAQDMGMYASPHSGYARQLQSAYEDTGPMGRGSKFSDLTNWMQATGGAVMHGGEMLANAADPKVPVNPNAATDVVQSLDTLLAPFSLKARSLPGSPIPEYKKPLNHWERAELVRNHIHADSAYNDPTAQARSDAAELEVGSPLSGVDYLRKNAGKLIHPDAATYLGATMDTVLDPHASSLQILKAARGMRGLGPWKAWANYFGDNAIPYGAAGLYTAMEKMAPEPFNPEDGHKSPSRDALIRRLGEQQ